MAGTVDTVFGTDMNRKSNVGPDDLVVSDPQDVAACKLNKPTRYCLKRARNLPATPYWMDVKRGPISNLPKHLMAELKRLLDRQAKRGYTIQHAAPVLALLLDKPGQRLACGAKLELRPHCATVRLDDFSAEFWFDDELTLGEDLLDLTRATPLLTGDEKAMALQVLVAKRVEAVMGSPFRPFNPPAA